MANTIFQLKEITDIKKSFVDVLLHLTHEEKARIFSKMIKLDTMPVEILQRCIEMMIDVPQVHHKKEKEEIEVVVTHTVSDTITKKKGRRPKGAPPPPVRPRQVGMWTLAHLETYIDEHNLRDTLPSKGTGKNGKLVKTDYLPIVREHVFRNKPRSKKK